mgnify:CR=1 FL=1
MKGNRNSNLKNGGQPAWQKINAEPAELLKNGFVWNRMDAFLLIVLQKPRIAFQKRKYKKEGCMGNDLSKNGCSKRGVFL